MDFITNVDDFNNDIDFINYLEVDMLWALITNAKMYSINTDIP